MNDITNPRWWVDAMLENQIDDDRHLSKDGNGEYDYGTTWDDFFDGCRGSAYDWSETLLDIGGIQRMDFFSLYPNLKKWEIENKIDQLRSRIRRVSPRGFEGYRDQFYRDRAADIRRNPAGIDIQFGSLLLKDIMEIVRQHISPETIKASWGYRNRSGRYAEFHIPPSPEFPKGFYYADQDKAIAHIKAEGWERALRSIGVQT